MLTGVDYSGIGEMFSEYADTRPQSLRGFSIVTLSGAAHNAACNSWYIANAQHCRAMNRKRYAIKKVEIRTKRRARYAAHPDYDKARAIAKHNELKMDPEYQQRARERARAWRVKYPEKYAAQKQRKKALLDQKREAKKTTTK